MQIDELKDWLRKHPELDFESVLYEEGTSEQEENILKSAGLSFTFVSQIGSGENARWVFKFNDNLYEVKGYFDSYDCCIDNVMDFYEVEAYEKTIICYRKKKNVVSM